MKKANLLLATMLLALSAASFAQADMKETVAIIKTNLAQSKEKVKQYAWIETTKTYIKGELKSTKQNQGYYSVDGQLTKVATGAIEQAKTPGGLRGKIAAGDQYPVTTSLVAAAKDLKIVIEQSGFKKGAGL
jgi:hypothetical protein